jgi:hypothetical protein
MKAILCLIDAPHLTALGLLPPDPPVSDGTFAIRIILNDLLFFLSIFQLKFQSISFLKFSKVKLW